jgi:hypothetical protein
MQRVLFVIAVVVSLFAGSAASASQFNGRQQMTGARKGPIAKLIELERRKNEWLRQQFLGR